VTYTPNADYHGPDSFKYTVKDNEGLVSNEATVSITMDSVNDAPVANDDTANTDEDTPVEINVISNDTDKDGTIDPTTITITQQPKHGTLTIDKNTGKIIYVPDEDYYGSDSFKYTVKDNDGLISSEAGVSITINSVEDDVRGKITGKVIEQLNGGKTKPISGVTLVLLDTDGNVVARTKTNSKGSYTFVAAPGSYIIQQKQPTAYYSVNEDEGGADDDAINDIPNAISVVLSELEVDIENNFVEKKVDPYTCSVCVPYFPAGHQLEVQFTNSNSTANIKWNPAQNNVNYEIYLNGKFVATVGKDTLEYKLSNLSSNTQYNVTIKAIGKFGGEASQVLKFKTPSVGTAWLPAIYNILL
jgi:hypothetical protein